MLTAIIEHLNQLDEWSLQTALTKCCASQRWVDTMVASRPFISDDAALKTAGEKWWQLNRADWIEAFAAHPKIGDVDSLRKKFANTRAWANGEQAGITAASETTLQRLAQLNREYQSRFGYIFIICATGKTADQMLTILESRLPNDPDTELRIAAAEQLKITLLRLQKLEG